MLAVPSWSKVGIPQQRAECFDQATSELRKVSSVGTSVDGLVFIFL